MSKTTLAVLLGLAVIVSLAPWTPSAAQRTFVRYHAISDLRATAQATPNMTVAVASGVGYIASTRVVYAGGNSGTFVKPGSNNRIDLLTINASGTLAITTGTAAATPSAPAIPDNLLPICFVYLKSTSTSIQAYNTGTATHGYILSDARPFVNGIPQDLRTTGSPTFADIIADSITLDNSGLHILDTNASHDLIFAVGSNLTADKTLTFTTGDAARTITLSGDPTLADWFDQGVKQASSVQFGAVTSSADISSTDATSRATLDGVGAVVSLLLTDSNSQQFQIREVSAATRSDWQIDTLTVNAGTDDANIAFFRLTDATSPNIVIYKGDNTATATMVIEASAGDLQMDGDLLVDGTNIGIAAETALITLGATEVDITANIDTTGVYKVDGTQVVSNQRPHIAVIVGAGEDADSYCRGKLEDLLAALEAHGLLASS